MAVPTSVMLQIEKAMYAALSAAGCPVPRVDRGFTGEYSADIMPAYNLALIEFSNGYGDRASTDDSLAVKATWGVFCYAAASGAITAADVLDPLIVWAHQQLGDESFGGLARSTELQGAKLNWNEKDGQNTVEAMLTVEVEFDVARNDPSQNFNG